MKLLLSLTSACSSLKCDTTSCLLRVPLWSTSASLKASTASTSAELSCDCPDPKLFVKPLSTSASKKIMSTAVPGREKEKKEKKNSQRAPSLQQFMRTQETETHQQDKLVLTYLFPYFESV